MANNTVKRKSKSLAKPNSRKPAPASIAAQKAWAGFSPKLKKELRKSLPDTDKDKVPDGFDCRPRNKKRQESFLPEDADYLRNCTSVKLGKRLGSGSVGDVYEVAGNPNLAVKIATGTADPHPASQWLRISRKELFDEWSQCDSYSADKQPLMTPTKAVKLSGYTKDGGAAVYGLVRPKVTPVWHLSSAQITESLIENIRRKVIQLSKDGYAFNDGLQLGVDRAGRVLAFDMGDVRLADTVDYAFYINNEAWFGFLKFTLGKNPDKYPDLYGNTKSQRSRSR